MELVQYNNDLVIQVGQKYGYNVEMKFRCLIHNTAYSSLSIQWDILFKDSEGEIVVNKIIQPLTLEQIANNTTLIDPATGNFVEEADKENFDFLIGEYDFYWQIANTTPIKLSDLILQAGDRFKIRVLNLI